jgi:hypothetical protein
MKRKKGKKVLTTPELIKARKNAEYVRRWREKHPEKYKEYMREYMRTHKKQLNTVQRFLKKLLKI